MTLFARAVIYFCLLSNYAFWVAQVTSSAASGTYIRVAEGDTLWLLSQKYNVPLELIVKSNKLDSPDQLQTGQKILIPGRSSYILTADFREMDRLCRVRDEDYRNWKYIVIHHSATSTGNAAVFTTYHKDRRRMKNGLAYHFVIGNGRGSADGKIELGSRWINQLAGGHTSSDKMNKVGIGICLVGNFERSYPTDKQFSSLVKLIRYLEEICQIPNENVILHREVKRGHTVCPGRRFPNRKLKKELNRRR